MKSVLSSILLSSLLLAPQIRTGAEQAAFDLDELKRNFKNPPNAYGPVPFYWWNGEPLSRERVAWQLDRLKENGFSGVNINYSHTNLGQTYRGDPPLFSDAWWAFWETVVEECAARDMAIGFDDYLITHGNPDLAVIGAEIREKHPEVAGQLLRRRTERLRTGQRYRLDSVRDPSIVNASAYRVTEGQLDPASRINLSAMAVSGETVWIDLEGEWEISILHTEPQPFGALNPEYAQRVIEFYFERFEKHSKGQLGKAVNYFFQDELTFGGSMPYWAENLPAEFERRKGYDLLPELTALFTDVGPRTPKVRLDYYDVTTQMMEDAYFKPIFEWCAERGITYGHDQIARADVIDGVRYYGDYFRALRWYQAPGTDRIPDLIRGKVSASIAGLYGRPRVWLEAYHSTGWGVSPEDIHRWDCESLLYGYNLFSYHSLYYSTRAGWWAWAPGDIHFRQPYWEWMRSHYKMLQRMSYLLSQGRHACDIAVLFPSSAVQADMNGTTPGEAAHKSRELLRVFELLFKEYGIDFDFIDDDSIARATIERNKLKVAGRLYSYVVLPGMKVIRQSTLDKLLEFHRAHGRVIALVEPPEASDRAGRDDPQLADEVREMFGPAAPEPHEIHREPYESHGYTKLARSCVVRPNTNGVRHYKGTFRGQWLWSEEPSRKVYFKGVWQFPKAPGKAECSAKILADNEFVFYINGERIAPSSDVQTGWTGTVKLAHGDVVTFDAKDHDPEGNKAGLFVSFARFDGIRLSTADLRYTTQPPADMNAWRRDANLENLKQPGLTNVHPIHSAAHDIEELAILLGGWSERMAGKQYSRPLIGNRSGLYVMRRWIGAESPIGYPRECDLYALYNPNGETVEENFSFRSVGMSPESWDPWTGEITPLPIHGFSSVGIMVHLRFEPHEFKVVVLSRDVARTSDVFSGKPDPRIERPEPPQELVETMPLEGEWGFHVEPVLDNRWGDFRSPASEEKLAPEARQFLYAETQDAAEAETWHEASFDDSEWDTVTNSWGPRFWLLGPIPKNTDGSSLEHDLQNARQIDPNKPIKIETQSYRWRPYSFSSRWSVENDPMLTRQTGIAIHGPIGWVPDEFIHLQTAGEGDTWYLWTSYQSPDAQETRIAIGSRAAYRAWLAGKPVLAQKDGHSELRAGPWNIVDYPAGAQRTAAVTLEQGGNPLLLKWIGGAPNTMVRGYVALGDDLQDKPAPDMQSIPSGDSYAVASGVVASRWYDRPQIAAMNHRPEAMPKTMGYRFPVPPGMKSMRFTAHGKPAVWIDGIRHDLRKGEPEDSLACKIEDAVAYELTREAPLVHSGTATVLIEPRPGFCAGAAIPEPIRFECEAGKAELGDWAGLGLATYSGSVRYARDVRFTPEQLRDREVWLDLGRVHAAAEVFINGQRAGLCLKRPFRVEITDLLHAGTNRVSIRVANTLANHYSTGMPSGRRYIFDGQTRSGLFGPVKIELTAPRAPAD